MWSIKLICVGILAHTASGITGTGPISTGYYNIFSGYSIKGYGCTITDPTKPLTIESYNLGQCMPYMTASGFAPTVLTMSQDTFTLYADVYTATSTTSPYSVCKGAKTTYSTSYALSSQTMGCTWSYTTSAIPAMQQAPTTLAAINAWVTTSYYTNTTQCAKKNMATYVYQGQVAVTQKCNTTCGVNHQYSTQFQYVQQACTYNPLYTPSGLPTTKPFTPTSSPTLVTSNKNAIIAGSVVGGLLLIGLLCGLYYCFGGESKKEENTDEYERMRVDRA